MFEDNDFRNDLQKEEKKGSYCIITPRMMTFAQPTIFSLHINWYYALLQLFVKCANWFSIIGNRLFRKDAWRYNVHYTVFSDYMDIFFAQSSPQICITFFQHYNHLKHIVGTDSWCNHCLVSSKDVFFVTGQPYAPIFTLIQSIFIIIVCQRHNKIYIVGTHFWQESVITMTCS